MMEGAADLAAPSALFVPIAWEVRRMVGTRVRTSHALRPAADRA